MLDIMEVSHQASIMLSECDIIWSEIFQQDDQRELVLSRLLAPALSGILDPTF